MIDFPKRGRGILDQALLQPDLATQLQLDRVLHVLHRKIGQLRVARAFEVLQGSGQVAEREAAAGSLAQQAGFEAIRVG